MGMIRPIYNNFSAGEISPKLAGRADLPVFQGGANKLHNMIPEKMGGARRRGGFKHIINMPVDAKARLIPWSVNDVTDFMLVLTDGAIRILDVSDGHTVAFLATDPDTSGGVLPIVALSSSGTSPAYAEADIDAVKYAQNIKSIYLAHPGYPLFYIKYNGDVTVGAATYAAFEYGPVNLEGNIASSTFIDAATGVTDVIPGSYLRSMLDVLANGIVYSAYIAVTTALNTTALVAAAIRAVKFPGWVVTGADADVIFTADANGVRGGTYALDPAATGITGTFARTTQGTVSVKEVQTLSITGACSANGNINITLNDNVYGHSGLSGTINNKTLVGMKKTVTATARSAHYAYSRMNFPNTYTYSGDLVDGSGILPGRLVSSSDGWYIGTDENNTLVHVAYNATGTTILALAAAELESGYQYAIRGHVYGVLVPDFRGGFTYNEAYDTTVYTLYFSDGTTLDVDADTVSVQGYLSMVYPLMSINKNATPGIDIMERCGVWMRPGVVYPCDQTVTLNGNVALSAIKDVSGAEPAIIVTLAGQPDPFRITASLTGITGQLGVILTPYYDRTDNPGFVCFHQNRMVIGGSTKEPNVFYLSETNSFTGFKYFEEVEYEKTVYDPDSPDGDPQYDVTVDSVQQIGAASAISMQLATDENESIQWAASVSDLILGTATSEWVMPAEVNALEPRAVLTSRNGSASIQGRFVNGSVLFIPRSRRGAKMFQPVLGQTTESITEQAEHLFTMTSQVISFDFRQDPAHEVLLLLENGKAVIGVINNDVVGWAPLYTRTGDLIESLVAIAANGEDAIYAVINRAISGDTARYIERLITPDDSVFDSRDYLDSWVAVTTGVIADPQTTPLLSGLARFYAQHPTIVFESGEWGELVVAIAGTSSTYIPNGTSVAVALPGETDAMVGYTYESMLQLPRIDSAQMSGLPKTAGTVHLRVLKSGSFHIRKTDRDGADDYLPDGVTLDEEVVSSPVDETTGLRIYPYTGALRTDAYSGATEDQYITFATQSPEPMTIQLVAPTFEVGDIL